MSGEASVVVGREGRAGLLRLDRRRALNALDLGMIEQMMAGLDRFAEDPAVECVVVVSDDPRAFCAGGDIRAMRERARAADVAGIRHYFATEYRLNLRIATFPKPYVALIDGICMGGGLGISMHGTARVVTEAAVMAMPETIIGFAPDIGASYVLPRLALPGLPPGALGRYLGLAGARVAGTDAVRCGLGTHFLPRDALAPLQAALARDGVAALRALPTSALPPLRFEADLPGIARCFASDDPAEILAALDAESGRWARETAAMLRGCSPEALCWTALLLARGAGSDLADCLGLELELATELAQGDEFVEGVRAALVDRDRAPAWRHARLEEVDRNAIHARFGELTRAARPLR